MKKLAPASRQRETIKLSGARIEVERLGKGRPLVLLHGEEAHEFDLPLIETLAARNEVILPWAPGYGRSPLGEAITSVDDIAYVYLDLLERLDLKGATLVGFSLGGWIAAEMATKTTARLDGLVLVGAVGAKFGGPLDRDIADIYFLPAKTVQALKYADPENDPHGDLSGFSDRAAMRVAQHRETTARLCWEPYFHNPALRHRLHRIDVDTLVVWGAKDGLTPPKYGRAYARKIPGARFAAIRDAGHYPHIERPEAFAAEIAAFVGRNRARK